MKQLISFYNVVHYLMPNFGLFVPLFNNTAPLHYIVFNIIISSVVVAAIIIVTRVSHYSSASASFKVNPCIIMSV